ncbi:MAG TPA: peptidyl-prolyl cis-trans isomerase [Terriglobales bacterium]|nr:peptidyl-prolyl cis-trans isomerase [Terriglobales bacterium]
MKSIINGAVCLLLLAGAAVSQTTTSAPVLKARTADPNELVPNTPIAPDTPVITIQGVCDKSAAATSTATCSTVITKAQFEKIVDTLQPNMSPAQKKQLATRYVTVLVLANKAQQLGLDKSPEFDEQMQLARLQTLAQEAQRKMQKDATDVSDDQISSYYQQHAADYKSISFERIFIPKQKQIDVTDEKPDDIAAAQTKRAASEPEMKAEADQLHERAASGEDFAKLQRDAYDFAGSKMKETSVKMDNMRKTSIPPSDASIFDLKTGEVSQVFGDQTGYRIYKVSQVTDLPLSSVHEEIKRTLEGQNIRTSFESLQKSTKATFDEAYFATPAPPSLRKPGEGPAAQGAPSQPAPGKK